MRTAESDRCFIGAGEEGRGADARGEEVMGGCVTIPMSSRNEFSVRPFKEDFFSFEH